MNKNHTGFILDNIFLSIGRAILRKEIRENRDISITEVKGHALTIQGQYNFVPNNESEKFAEEIVRAFQYVKKREISSISSKAYILFKKDELFGNSILDEELVQELKLAYAK